VGGEELSDAERDQLLELCRQRLTLSECSAARRWAVCSRRSLRLRAQEPPPHPDQRLDQSPGAHPGQRTLRMLRGGLLLGKPRTRGPWRWTPSCPGTRAARTTSATCSALLPLQGGQAMEGARRAVCDVTPSPQSRRRMWRAESTAPGGQGSPSTASPATSEVPTAWWATRRWADCSCRSLRLRAPQPPPHADQRLDQIPGVHPCQGPLRMLRGRLLLGKPRTSEPWRSTPSYPGTRAVRTTSATCRPSAFAAMPASDGRREAGAHRRADGWGR